MRISKNWDGFMDLLDTRYPRFGETGLLPTEYGRRSDDGRYIIFIASTAFPPLLSDLRAPLGRHLLCARFPAPVAH